MHPESKKRESRDCRRQMGCSGRVDTMEENGDRLYGLQLLQTNVNVEEKLGALESRSGERPQTQWTRPSVGEERPGCAFHTAEGAGSSRHTANSRGDQPERRSRSVRSRRGGQESAGGQEGTLERSRRLLGASPCCGASTGRARWSGQESPSTEGFHSWASRPGKASSRSRVQGG